MRNWNRTPEELQILVDAFFLNDPYYPRPRLFDAYYPIFKAAYLSGYPSKYMALGEGFLTMIEEEQAGRDAAAQATNATHLRF